MSNLASLLKKKGDFKESSKLYKTIVISTEKSLGKKHVKTLKSKQSLAVIFREMECFDDAIILLKEVIILRREQNDLEGCSSSLTALGTTYLRQELFEKAHEFLNESINIRRDLLANGDENILGSLVSSLNRLLDLYQKTGQKKKWKKLN